MHRVHDVVADAQIGQRDRHAFLDGAHLDALGRRAEDLAVAEHAQAQRRNREAGSRSIRDRRRCRRARGVRPRFRRRAACRWCARRAELTMKTRLARRDPLAHRCGEEVDLPVEMLDRDGIRRRTIRARAATQSTRERRLDPAGQAQRSVPSDRLADLARTDCGLARRVRRRSASSLLARRRAACDARARALRRARRRPPRSSPARRGRRSASAEDNRRGSRRSPGASAHGSIASKSTSARRCAAIRSRTHASTRCGRRRTRCAPALGGRRKDVDDAAAHGVFADGAHDVAARVAEVDRAARCSRSQPGSSPARSVKRSFVEVRRAA